MTMMNSRSNMMTVEEYRKLTAKKTEPKRSKYNAIRTETNGIQFDSKKEANRYQMLQLLLKAKEITGLQLQVKFQLEGTSYVADFVYFDYAKKQWVVEDVKGVRNNIYRNKKKAMYKRYGITILET